MQFTSETIAARDVVFDLVLEDIPGGVSLDTTRIPADTEWIESGTPVYYVPTTRVAEVVKTAKIYAEASGGASTPKIVKGSLFKAGDYITDGTIHWVISSLVATGANYDTFTLGGSLVTTAADTVLIQGTSAASGTTTAYYTPNGFIKDWVCVGDGVALYDNADASLVVRGAVRDSALPFPLTSTFKTALSLFRFNA